MRKVYIVSLCRTAVGSFGGSLKDVKVTKLGAAVIQEALKRGKVDPALVDEVIFGNVLQTAQGQNTARQAAMAAGVPKEVPAVTVNKVCGSGLYTVTLAKRTILAGDAECVIAGGMESMSQAPYATNALRWGAKMGDVAYTDVMITDGLWDAYYHYHMGITAENVAEQYGVTREMQDNWAYRSHMRAAAAAEKFQEEIVPFEVPQRKGDPVLFNRDEFVKPNTSLEKLAALKPAFKPGGTVTAGNASGINDGAAAVIVASEDFVKEHGLEPMAEIVASGSAGVDPSVMGIGPVPAVRKALKKANLTVEDIDLIEANEAFAAQTVAVANELGLDTEKVNVNGGAVAIGHPIGCSGARILVTLLYEMRRRGAKYGLATLCIGGGMGETLIVKM